MADLTPEPASQVTVWSVRPPVDLAHLDDQRLTDYRHPDERQALITIAVGFAVLLIGLGLTQPSVDAWLHWLPTPILRSIIEALHPTRLAPLILLGLAVLTAIDGIGLYMKRYELPYEGVEINAVTFPQLGPVVEELQRRFEMPPTRVFATRTAPLPGDAFGLREPYLIVFSTVMLASLTAEEFRLLLGRQMGHVKLGHTRMAIIFGGALPLSFAWLGDLRRLLYGYYQRAQVLSADRIGLLASRDPRPMLSFLTKLEIGTIRGAKIDLDSLTPQALEFRWGPSATPARWRQRFSSKPSFIFRLLELTEWAGLPPPPPAPGAPSSTAAPAAATGLTTSDPAGRSAGR